MNANKALVVALAASLIAAPLAALADRKHRDSAPNAAGSAPAVLPLAQAMALAEAYSGGKVVAIEGRGYSATHADVAEAWRVRVVKPDGSASRLVIDGRSGELVGERGDRPASRRGDSH
jgi:hypothetical protein